jgi:hypothetical protein
LVDFRTGGRGTYPTANYAKRFATHVELTVKEGGAWVADIPPRLRCRVGAAENGRCTLRRGEVMIHVRCADVAELVVLVLVLGGGPA